MKINSSMLMCAAWAFLSQLPPTRRGRSADFVIVFNEAPTWDTARDGVVADIANAAPIDADGEWFQVAPYGEHPNKVGLQVFTKAAADKMVASFNSLSAKVGRLFRGAPIYAGHPDVDPGRWPDSRRLGKITALEARNDGLFAKAEWNTLGVENSEQGFYVFPSPRWLCEKVGKGLLPVELISVGLTNTPNIRASAPVTANDAGTEGTEGTEGTADATNDALVAMTAERDAALGQVNSLTTERNGLQAQLTAANNALTTERDGLQAQLTAANDALTAERASRRDTILDHAVESGRIAAADRPALVALFNSDFTAAEADLKKRKPAYNTAPLNLERDRQGLQTEHERHVARQEAVNSIMKERGISYDDAWALAKKGAKTKALFEAATA